ncbi:MAG: translocation protein TolB, partial [Pseudoalteromonas shioyasakiensis]
PDAQRVVVTRNVKNNQKALFLIDVKTGQSQRLTHDFVDIHGVDWHPSKEQLAFSAVEGGKRYGYFFDLKNKTLINTQIAGMSSPNYSSDGSVYYHQWDLDKVITRLKIDEQVANSPFSMLSTNFSSLFPEYNQQQNKLLYVSNESGSSQLWIVNPDSSSRKQLTDFAHNTGEVRDPTWSADGRYILFSLYDNGSTRLYIYDFKVEQSQQIKLPFSHAIKPKFSADSQHILVSDGDYLYRYDLTGKSLGKAVEVPAQYGVETQSGDILFTNSRHAIWIKHHDTGVEEMLVNDVKLARSYAWLLVAKNAYHEGRIYYYKERLGDYRISYYDLASKQHHDLIALPERAYSRSSGLTYIPNERWLVYTAYLSPEIEIKRLPAAYLPK